MTAARAKMLFLPSKLRLVAVAVAAGVAGAVGTAEERETAVGLQMMLRATILSRLEAHRHGEVAVGDPGYLNYQPLKRLVNLRHTRGLTKTAFGYRTETITALIGRLTTRVLRSSSVLRLYSAESTR
jgi:hypothetical protein